MQLFRVVNAYLKVGCQRQVRTAPQSVYHRQQNVSSPSMGSRAMPDRRIELLFSDSESDVIATTLIRHLLEVEIGHPNPPTAPGSPPP